MTPRAQGWPSTRSLHSIKVQGQKHPGTPPCLCRLRPPRVCHRFKYDPNTGPRPQACPGPFPCFNWRRPPSAILMPSMQAPWHKQYKWWHWRRSLRTRTYFNEARVWSPLPWSGLGGRKVSLTFRSQSVSSNTARARPSSVWSLEMLDKFIPTQN